MASKGRGRRTAKERGRERERRTRERQPGRMSRRQRAEFWRSPAARRIDQWVARQLAELLEGVR
jgi:hypothetical protein